MQYAVIPGCEKPLSRLIFGAANADLQKNQDMDALLDAIFAAGINAFDTARIYGESECALGRWMEKRGNREKIFLITKGCHHNAWRKRVTVHDLKSDLSDSLVRLQTDSIDLYLLHRDDPAQPVGPIVETLNELHAAGKIRCFGGSNWSHERLAEANEYAAAHHLLPFSVSSPFYSLVDQYGDPWRDGVKLTGAENREARAWYKENQMPVLAYSSMGRGFLSGKFDSSMPLSLFPAEHQSEENMEKLRRTENLAREKGCSVSQISLSWLLHQLENVFPVLGIRNEAQLKENLGALEVHLTAEECRFLNLE